MLADWKPGPQSAGSRCSLGERGDGCPVGAGQLREVVTSGICFEGRNKFDDVLDVECEIMNSHGGLQGILA